VLAGGELLNGELFAVVGLVEAQFSTDPELRALLPEALQDGLFDGRCDNAPARAYVRFSHSGSADEDGWFSHTKAMGRNLARMAVSIETADGQHTNLTATESIRSFAVANKKQLDTYVYGEEHGMAWTCLAHPRSTKDLENNSSETKKEFSRGRAGPSRMAGVLGKSYYSMGPFAIGTGAAKFAFKSDLRTSDEHDAAAMQQALVSQLASADVVFDVMVQVAIDPLQHPVDDAAVDWDESTAPYIKLGELRIMQQQINASNATNAGLSTQLDVSTLLQFGIGEGDLHKPVGYVNQFRAQLYSLYHKARESQLLEEAAAGKCPSLAANASFGLLHM